MARQESIDLLDQTELELASGQIVFVSPRNGGETSVGAPGLGVGDEIVE